MTQMSIKSDVKSFTESTNKLNEPIGNTETKLIEDEYVQSGNVSLK